MAFPDLALAGQPAGLQRSLANRRAYVRYQCGPATAGRVKLEGQEWQRAWVLDICLNGVGLLLNRTLEIGLTVVVHLITAAQNKVLELHARVCHATCQADGEWIIGCEFADKLSEEELDAVLQ